MRIALIGLGDIAQKAYLPVVASHPQITPVLCTRNADVRAKLSAQYRIEECYASIDELIAVGVDGAMIHSSTSSHAGIATQLLRAGIAVFIDKPLSYSQVESEDMLDLAVQKNLPLMVGFNRRYAPLIQPLKDVPDPIQVLWQKNRVDLADTPRVFIFDDFIHVLDGLRFLSQGAELEQLQVFSHYHGDKLGAVRVQWQSQGCLFNASMNRVSGATEERLEYFSVDNSWRIDSLTEGSHWQAGQSQALGFGDWSSTLHKRGFEAMLQAWVELLEAGVCDKAIIEDIRATHALCEQVVAIVEQQKPSRGE